MNIQILGGVATRYEIGDRWSILLMTDDTIDRPSSIFGSCARRPRTCSHASPSGGKLMNGEMDGMKYLCRVPPSDPNCTVFSLGSAGDYSFEEAILNSTMCTVHTFDCSIQGASILPGRHIFHKVCLGSHPDHDSAAAAAILGDHFDPENFKTWTEVSLEGPWKFCGF